MSEFIELEGFNIPIYKGKSDELIPKTNLILTKTTKSNLRKIIPPLLQGHNILLVGDAGVGKNAIIYYINYLRQTPTLRYSFNEDTINEDLVGAYRIHPETKTFEWSDGPLVKALRHGYTFVADEMNLSSPDILKRFYNLFSDHELQIFEGDYSILKTHKNFNFIATQNPVENFEGRKELSREIKKYFTTIYIDSYSQDELVEIISKKEPTLPLKLIENIVLINFKIENLLEKNIIGNNDLERYHFNLRNLSRLAKRLSYKYSTNGNEKNIQAPLKNQNKNINNNNENLTNFYIEEELADIYIRVFRKKEDQNIIINEITKILYENLDSYNCNFSFLNESISSNTFYDKSSNNNIFVNIQEYKIQIGRAELNFLNDENLIPHQNSDSVSNPNPNPNPNSNSNSNTIEENVLNALSNFPITPHSLPYLESIARAIQCGENILLECSPNVEVESYVKFFSELLGRKLRIITLAKGMHTSDIVGGLKPIISEEKNNNKNLENINKLEWVDGPLTAAMRNGEFIFLRGLDAAGPELVEKLNMLLDDQKSILLPPEQGENQNLFLKNESRIFGLKFFRNQRSTPTISRAFRNRFSGFVIDEVKDKESLKEICAFYLNLDDYKNLELENPLLTLINVIVEFHLVIIEMSKHRHIGREKIKEYEFGLLNLKTWCDFILLNLNNINNNKIKFSKIEISNILNFTVSLAYINEIADQDERNFVLNKLLDLLENENFDNLLESFLKKKIDNLSSNDKLLIKKKSLINKISWDQNKSFRKANTGKFTPKIYGEAKKKGLNINTPETGGKTKEGEHAWYGSDTEGNKGQGEPGGGGGAWGYRTEELYKDFIARRKNLWDYDLAISYNEFKDAFGPELQKITINFDKLIDPDIKLERLYKSRGTRVDVKKFLSYELGKGDERIFDKTNIISQPNKLKGVEIIFAINKGRRMFNFEYSLSCVVALMGISLLLKDHHIPFTICGYSDLNNLKQNINLEYYKKSNELLDENLEKSIFNDLISNWHGDTVVEQHVLNELSHAFNTHESRTRLLVMFSDFRGFRSKIESKISFENKELMEFKENIIKVKNRGIILLGVGLGPRSHVEEFFEDSISLDGFNFSHLPSILTAKICNLIYLHHKIE